jgi:hypothetical protein
MEYHSTQRCAFPPCTHSFPKLNHKKKYCSGCCRVKDFNRRKRNQDQHYVAPAVSSVIKPSMVEPVSLVALPVVPPQIEGLAVVKKGMSLAGVGESAIGTAGAMLLKDWLFDKNHRAKLEQQMDQFQMEQAIIVRQLQELIQEIKQPCRVKEGAPWEDNLLM